MKPELLLNLILETEKALIQEQRNMRKQFKSTCDYKQGQLYKAVKRNSEFLSSLQSGKKQLRKDIKHNSFSTSKKYGPFNDIKNLKIKAVVNYIFCEIQEISFWNCIIIINQIKGSTSVFSFEDIQSIGEDSLNAFKLVKSKLSETAEYEKFIQATNTFQSETVRTKELVDEIEQQIEELREKKLKLLKNENLVALKKVFQETEKILNQKEKELWKEIKG